MEQKTLNIIVGVVFAIVSFLHLLRLLLSGSVIIGYWNVPMWISWVGFIISGCLSYLAFRLAAV